MKKNKPEMLAVYQTLGTLILGFSMVSCLGSNQKLDLPEDQLSPETIDQVEPDDLPLELTPSNDIFAVSGLSQGESLTLYLDPSSSSEIVGQIPPYGTGLRPTGNIQIRDGFNWVQVQYLDLTGWVDFTHLAEQYGDLPDELIKLGQQVLMALKNNQYTKLGDIIHPYLCLRFSPYSYLNSDNQVICRSEIASGSLSEEERLWGKYDGTGNPIILTFNTYHKEFVYDQDYLHSTVVGLNQEVSSGNSINNISDLYPDGMMIEYHFPGIDPQYGGLDWRSIRLVFVQLGSEWYLTAIVHGEWTI